MTKFEKDYVVGFDGTSYDCLSKYVECDIDISELEHLEFFSNEDEALDRMMELNETI